MVLKIRGPVDDPLQGSVNQKVTLLIFLHASKMQHRMDRSFSFKLGKTTFQNEKKTSMELL